MLHPRKLKTISSNTTSVKKKNREKIYTKKINLKINDKP